MTDQAAEILYVEDNATDAELKPVDYETFVDTVGRIGGLQLKQAPRG